jgi:hypothetical protein
VTKQTTALSGTTNSYGLYLYPTSSGLSYVESITSSSGTSSLGFRTYNNGTYNELRIDSSGRLGINNNSPLAFIQASGSASIPAANFNNIVEPATVSATAATGTINYDVCTQSVLYYTSNASANWTLNIRGSSTTSLNTLMAVNDTITVVHMVTQGATAYYNNALTIDGSSVTPKYQGGTAWTAGNVSGIDVYTYTIIKTASATFTILASQTQFK